MPRTDFDNDLLTHGRDLDRLRRRNRRLKRQMERGTADWLAWFEATDAAFGLVDQIVRTPAHNLSGVAVKLDAVAWYLEETTPSSTPRRRASCER